MTGRDDMASAGETIFCDQEAVACNVAEDTADAGPARPDVEALRQSKTARRKPGRPARQASAITPRASTTPDVLQQSPTEAPTESPTET